MSIVSPDAVGASTRTLVESPKIDGPLRRVLTEEHPNGADVAHFTMLIGRNDLDVAEEMVRASGGDVVRSARWGRGTMRLHVTSRWDSLADLEQASVIRELGLTQWFEPREELR